MMLRLANKAPLRLKRPMNWRKVLLGEWNWKRPIKSLLSIYLILCIVAVFFADHLIFVPPAPSYGPDFDGLLHLETKTGESVAAIHHEAAAGMPTILYSHGNAEDLGQALELHQAWHEQGFGILAYDYPGYGCSAGRPNEASCERAIQAAWNHLIRSGVPASSIVIVSRSVGGGPGVWLASQENAAGMVLISPFTSAFAVPFPFPLFPGDRFPNLKRIREIKTPLLVIHGENDEVIPVAHGRNLVEASPAADKSFIPIQGAGHNDLFVVAGDEIIGRIADFARRVAR
jgi:abhydrolase domain-containing protein 17